MNSKIITIDGPSGVGKGTLAKNLSDELDWIVLDSGSLYRMVGYLSLKNDTKDFSEIRKIINKEEISFKFLSKNSNISLFLGEDDLSEFIRNEEVAKLASEFAVIPEVREYLFKIQRAFLDKGKGLIADGRDMGTILFPEAKYKFFITASAEERARRRENQLKESGLSVNMRNLQERIEERDKKDSSREISPLVPAEDAVVIDSSNIGIYELKDKVLNLIRS
jgi:cytidylate kinase|tara:strand:- start:2350 stop:3015 length:666 start_codon:yes stop_codon:yes gene_type:complete